MVPVEVVGVVDPDPNDEVTITITSIFQDEPVNTITSASSRAIPQARRAVARWPCASRTTRVMATLASMAGQCSIRLHSEEPQPGSPGWEFPARVFPTLWPTGDPEYFPVGVKHRYSRTPLASR